ncbi:MAG: hypothetical protein ACK2T6_09115 [Anaerolineae bacterium]
MERGTVARWLVAALVFMLIGLIDMRFGHAAGLATLVLVLLGVFALDVGAIRSGAGRTDGR